ncbi:hypothetical protein ACFFRR_003652 [Megaselia abdita]
MEDQRKEEIDVTEEFHHLTEILQNSSLLEYLESFASEDMTDEVLINSDSDNIWRALPKLLPTCGKQLRFQQAWDSWKKKQNQDEPPEVEQAGAEEKVLFWKSFNQYENLKDILVEYNVYDGLKAAHAKGLLDKPDRKMLSQAFAEWTARNLIWINMSDYPVIVEKILELFEGECKTNYFNPISPTNKNAGGCLYNAVKFRYRKLKQECNISRNRPRQKKETDEQDDQDDEFVEDEQDEQEEGCDQNDDVSENELLADKSAVSPEEEKKNKDEEARKKLITRFEPWSLVTKLWAELFDMRRAEVMNKHLPLSLVLRRWPKYKDVRGMEMMDIDFEKLFEGKGNKFYDSWEKWQSVILSKALAKAIRQKEKKPVLKDFRVEKESKWYDISCLKALVYLLPS